MNKKRVLALIAVLGTAAAAQAYVRIFNNDNRSVALYAASSDNNTGVCHQRELVPGDTKFGFINMKGDLVVPATYERAHEFSEGLAVVEVNRKWGYIDRTGKQVIAAQFHTARDFSYGLAAARKGMYGGYLNKAGEFAIEPKYGQIDDFDASGTAKVSIGKSAGRIDTKGNFVVAPKYRKVGSISKDLFWIDDNEKYGIVDRKGKIIVRPQYDEIGKMSEALIPFKKSDRWGYLDKDGNVKIGAKYLFAGAFLNGVAFAKQAKGNNTLIAKDGEVVFTFPKKTDGVTLISNTSSVANAPVFEGGLIPMMEKGRWGYASTTTGGFVIKPQYASAAPFKNGLALVGITKRTPEKQFSTDADTTSETDEDANNEKVESENEGD